MPSVREIWKTKGLVNDPDEDGTAYSPATALTDILGAVENLPDDIEILKSDQAAIRTEVAALREGLAAELAPAILDAITNALSDGLSDETLVTAAEQGVRRVLRSIPADPSLMDRTTSTGGADRKATR
ncbi:MAG: hypothetical protein ACRDXX_10885 [Stackebrandtia sp.]